MEIEVVDDCKKDFDAESTERLRSSTMATFGQYLKGTHHRQYPLKPTKRHGYHPSYSGAIETNSRGRSTTSRHCALFNLGGHNVIYLAQAHNEGGTILYSFGSGAA